MSLLTYDDVRPRAKDIRDKIDEGAMPPWHADMPHGTFLNERGLTEQEKSTIFRWVANGAPKGDPKDMPPAPDYPNGWSIGTPDVVFEMPEEYHVPADDVVQYEYFYIPTNFTEAEVGAGDRGPAGQPQRRAPRARPIQGEAGHAAHAGAEVEPGHLATSSRRSRTASANAVTMCRARLLATYAPGTNPQVFRPGTALRLEPGGVLELQMHYTVGRTGRDGSHQGRDDLLEGSVRRAKSAPGSSSTRRCGCRPVPPTSRWMRMSSSRRTRPCGACSRTRTCAARNGSTSCSCRTDRRETILSVPRLRLQLADLLHVQGAAAGAEGIEDSSRARGTTIPPAIERTRTRPST